MNQIYQYAADHTTLTCCCMHLEVWLSALTMQQHRCLQETCNMLHPKGNNQDAVHIAVLLVSVVVMLPLTVNCCHRVDLRWRRKPEELSELAALQVSTSSCCLLSDQLLTLT